MEGSNLITGKRVTVDDIELDALMPRVAEP